MNRREFFMTTGGALAAVKAGATNRVPTLCFFSKHLAELDYTPLAKTLRELGFPGVDLTVRPQGHVLPERVADDLPKAIGILREHGLEVPMITTGLVAASDPPAAATLSTAGKLKVPYFKPGYYRYTDLKRVEQRVRDTRDQFRGLVELARQHGVQAGFHNHSGNYVGAAMWDAREVVRDLDSQYAGYYFDPAHAVAEGGFGGWNIGFHLLAARMKMVAAKDFYWEKAKGKWQMRWCPLGEGMVPWAAVFKQLAEIAFGGPISLHLEYDLPKDPLPAIARDLEYLKTRLREAYGHVAAGDKFCLKARSELRTR